MFALFSSSAQALPGSSIRPIVLENQLVPTEAGTASIAYIEESAGLNNDGQVAFTASLVQEPGSVDSTNNAGIWLRNSNGQLELAARKGRDSQFGTQSELFGYRFRQAFLSENGQIVFENDLLPGSAGVTTSNDNGIWVFRDGQIELIAREGSSLPGLSSQARVDNFRDLVISGSGQVGFVAGLQQGIGGIDSWNAEGIWAERNGALARIAQGGQHPAGTNSSVDFLGLHVMELNASGEVLIGAGLRIGLGGVGFGNSSGFWKDSGLSQELIVRAGSPTPIPGTIFVTPAGGAINRQGEVAFTSIFRLPSGENTFGLWLQRDTGLTLVAAVGTPISNRDANATLINSSVINDASEILSFVSYVPAGETRQQYSYALWSEGELNAILHDGMPAPGVPGDAEFIVNFGLPMHSAVLNNHGQVAIQGRLTGTGIDESNDRGIWATDINGDLQLIVREGDTLELGPGDSRVISSLRFHDSDHGQATNDGRLHNFNDKGQILFWARFTDHSTGLFLSDLVAVPEPTTISLALVLAISSMICRRRNTGFRGN